MWKDKNTSAAPYLCRAVVIANLLWALSLSAQELAFFWSQDNPTTLLLLQVSFFRLIKQRRSGWSLRKFSWAKFQCSISPVSEGRTKEGSKVLVFKPPRKDFACETFVIKDYEIRSWLWMSLNILCRGKLFPYDDDWRRTRRAFEEKPGFLDDFLECERPPKLRSSRQPYGTLCKAAKAFFKQ